MRVRTVELLVNNAKHLWVNSYFASNNSPPITGPPPRTENQVTFPHNDTAFKSKNIFKITCQGAWVGAVEQMEIWVLFCSRAAPLSYMHTFEEIHTYRKTQSQLWPLISNKQHGKPNGALLAAWKCQNDLLFSYSRCTCLKVSLTPFDCYFACSERHMGRRLRYWGSGDIRGLI